ncbi:MAG: hypothetical protein LBB89_00155 [Treponema sp.]|jgi:hypothetical protein|nr:hypothetical protein [Treponema sp.]
MKNLVKLLALSAVVLLTTLSLTACDNGGGGGTHTHTWGNWTQTTAPTCTTAGVDTRTCTLDPTHKETRAGAAALGHTPNTETGLCTVCNALTYNLDDTGPGGGKIFYRLEAGFTMTDTNEVCHYLEAAPADMSTELAWASSGYTTTDISGTGSKVGTGRKNTALILATDANAPAAKACKDYSNGGKTDWFLPSNDELYELYIIDASLGNYWSSSQSIIISNFNEYAGVKGSSGFIQSGKKEYTYSVRAVRAF